MRARKSILLILQIIWLIWYILPALLAVMATFMLAGMALFPFVDDGNVVGYYLTLLSIGFFAGASFTKLGLMIYQIRMNWSGHVLRQFPATAIQLLLSVPLTLILMQHQSELAQIIPNLNPWYAFPIFIEACILLASGFFLMLHSPQVTQAASSSELTQ